MHESVRNLFSAEVSVVDDRPRSTVRRTSEAVNEKGEVIDVVHLNDGYEVGDYVLPDDWERSILQAAMTGQRSLLKS